jgi:serpin B
MRRYVLLAVFVLAAPAWGAPMKADREEAAKATTAFAVSMYHQVRGHKGNLFFSPVSISTALCLAGAGAKGETRAQIAKVIHLPEKDAAATLVPLLSALSKRTSTGTHVKLATGLWSQKGLELRPEFLAAGKKLPGASLAQLDFAARPEPSRAAINEFVEKATGGRVKGLLQKDSVSKDTKLVLASAIHFKGDWAFPFDKKLTESDTFHGADRKVKMQFMRQRGEFAYRKGPAIAALELPFAGNEASMVFIMPNPDDPKIKLEDVEKTLTPKEGQGAKLLTGWLGDLKVQKVDVVLPRFKLAVQYDLKEALSEMGMPLAFTSKADLSGITPKGKLQLSDVFHRAYVDVNEKGSEAGAATGIKVTPKSITERIPVFRADKPFLFLILDRKTDSILFIGRLSHPRAS